MSEFFFDRDPGPEIRRKLNEMWAVWELALEQAVGPQGWAPVIGVVTDGARRVLQIVDWTGGEGTKPTITGYLGPTGIVPTAAQATDIRGTQGLIGPRGWAPLLAVVADGARRVHQIIDWAGGSGEKPDLGYLGPSGTVATPAEATDLRGGQGLPGNPGPPNNLGTGSIETGAPGSNVEASVTGTYPNQVLNLKIPRGDGGAEGDAAWNPALALALDGERIVFRILDWTGGDGTKPPVGYLSTTGLVETAAEATDVRGGIGQEGPPNELDIGTVSAGETAGATITGSFPNQLLNLVLPIGPKGDAAWNAVFGAAADGERRVLLISDWVGGEGDKPETGYLGETGLVETPEEATDVRGQPGAGSVSSVNDVEPDGSGNVNLEIEDIPGLEEALTNPTISDKTIGGGVKEGVLDTGTGIVINEAAVPWRVTTLTANRSVTVNLPIGVSRSLWVNPATFALTLPANTWLRNFPDDGLPANKWSLITFTGKPGDLSGIAIFVSSED